jgi:hypothetical protein
MTQEELLQTGLSIDEQYQNTRTQDKRKHTPATPFETFTFLQQ